MSPQPAFIISLENEWRDGYGGTVAYHRNGKRWATGQAGVLHLWREETLRQSLPLPGYGGTPLCFSEDGRWLFAGPYRIELGSERAQRLPALSESLVAQLPAPQPPDAFTIGGAAWQPDGSTLALTALYAPPRGLHPSPRYDGPTQRLLLLDGKTGALERVLWEGQELSPPSKLLLTQEWLAAAGTDITIWRRADGERLATLQGHRAGVRALVLDSSGRQLASTDAAGEARLWNVTSWQSLAAWQAHRGAATTFSFNPGIPLLATGGEDGLVRFWHPSATPTLLLDLPQGERVEGLTFDPGGLRFLVASRFRDQRLRRYTMRQE